MQYFYYAGDSSAGWATWQLLMNFISFQQGCEEGTVKDMTYSADLVLLKKYQFGQEHHHSPRPPHKWYHYIKIMVGTEHLSKVYLLCNCPLVRACMYRKCLIIWIRQRERREDEKIEDVDMKGKECFHAMEPQEASTAKAVLTGSYFPL